MVIEEDKVQIIPGTKLALLALELVNVVREPQYAQMEMNKSLGIRAMTTTAWKAIPQRSIITIVWNPTT